MRSWRKARQASLASIAFRLLPPSLARSLKNIYRKHRLAASAPLQAQLQEIVQRHEGVEQVLIFPPSLDWQVQLFQRPQQLALALARQGALVFYVQPTTYERLKTIQPIRERLYLCNVPVEAFDVFEEPTIYLLTWNRGYATAFHSPQVIYDYVDDIKVFDGNYARMALDHEKLIRSSRLVLTTAERLYQQVIPLRPDALLCPNGVDYEHFAETRCLTNGPPPVELEPFLATGNPIVGYYGALAEWFDYDLVKSLAKRRSDLSFVLIGPDYDGTLPPGFLNLPNTCWLGVKPYAELPRYLRCFDVAMIPFQLNDITHSTSPLKLFEYMAGGKPVVITPMHESMRCEGVLVADGPEEFSRKIDEALKLKSDPQYLQQIDRVARQNTWDVRARQILEALRAIAD
jgi:glycosyltransferase involved in cell wall biosynthesis